MMIIEIDKLVKRYGDFVALNHFDLQVQEGWKKAVCKIPDADRKHGH